MNGEAVVVAVPAPGRWGTWEELLLGGAVLRHGTRDWELVASELRSRILCPFDFSPEECRSEYEESRRRFSGCKAWFEELRKRRIEELRRALEKSESSIGSLLLKLENLKAKKEESDHTVDYDSSRTVSLEPVQKPKRGESFHRDSPKDEVVSSSSFTPEASTYWSAEEGVEAKPNVFVSCKQWRDPRLCILGDLYIGPVSGCIRKKRGNRKRKDCGNRGQAKEGSVGESEFVSPVDVVAESCESKETSTSNNGSTKHNEVDLGRCSGREEFDNLLRVFRSVIEHKSACVFLERLDCQRKGRYKKLIRRHIDLGMIRTNLTNRTTTSSMEFFRDLMLLVNNALIFYANNTKEHEATLLLRDTITQTILCESNKDSNTPKEALEKPNPPSEVKPRSSFTSNSKSRAVGRSRKVGDSRVAPSSGPPAAGRGRGGGTRRGRGGNQGQRSVSTGRGRKRARTK